MSVLGIRISSKTVNIVKTCAVFNRVLPLVSGPHQSPAINVESLFCDQRPRVTGDWTPQISPGLARPPSSDAGDMVTTPWPLVNTNVPPVLRQQTGGHVVTAKRVAKH